MTNDTVHGNCPHCSNEITEGDCCISEGQTTSDDFYCEGCDCELIKNELV